MLHNFPPLNGSQVSLTQDKTKPKQLIIINEIRERGQNKESTDKEVGADGQESVEHLESHKQKVKITVDVMVPHLCVCVRVNAVERPLELRLLYIQESTPPSLCICHHPLWICLCHHLNLR